MRPNMTHSQLKASERPSMKQQVLAEEAQKSRELNGQTGLMLLKKKWGDVTVTHHVVAHGWIYVRGQIFYDGIFQMMRLESKKWESCHLNPAL